VKVLNFHTFLETGRPKRVFFYHTGRAGVPRRHSTRRVRLSRESCTHTDLSDMGCTFSNDDSYEEHNGEPPPPLTLGPLLGNLPPNLFQQEVLRRLGPKALASLAGAGRGCAAAVASTALMQWAKHAKMTPPGKRGVYLPPMCLKVACSYAARGGKQEVLEWLHNTGCPWDAWTTCAAAAGGRLKMLRWLHTQGCPWDALTCTYAAWFGHLRVLQWQGLTLAHFNAQLERFVWDRGGA